MGASSTADALLFAPYTSQILSLDLLRGRGRRPTSARLSSRMCAILRPATPSGPSIRLPICDCHQSIDLGIDGFVRERVRRDEQERYQRRTVRPKDDARYATKASGGGEGIPHARAYLTLCHVSLCVAMHQLALAHSRHLPYRVAQLSFRLDTLLVARELQDPADGDKDAGWQPFEETAEDQMDGMTLDRVGRAYLPSNVAISNGHVAASKDWIFAKLRTRAENVNESVEVSKVSVLARTDTRVASHTSARHAQVFSQGTHPSFADLWSQGSGSMTTAPKPALTDFLCPTSKVEINAGVGLSM